MLLPIILLLQPPELSLRMSHLKMLITEAERKGDKETMELLAAVRDEQSGKYSELVPEILTYFYHLVNQSRDCSHFQNPNLYHSSPQRQLSTQFGRSCHL